MKSTFMQMNWLVFLIAFILSLVLVPLVRNLANRFGQVADPRSDRWHEIPTPAIGGIGIFGAFFLAIIIAGPRDQFPWELLIASGLAFFVGLIDDLKSLSPQAKLVGLFLAASVVVFSGNVTGFFSWQVANIAISFIWMVGIANALNLLDNMDGLASGTSLVVSAFLAYFFWRAGNTILFSLTLAMAGATLGFFIFNFPPASIFMGDSGSLFLGLTLASFAISREDQASNVFAVVGVPTLIFLLPILDTAMVSLTRLLRGQSPAQGGRDHTSHRLVALGLSERQTLFVLLGIAIFSGVSAVILEALSYTLSLILIPIVVLIFTLFSAYLGQLKVVDADISERAHRNLLTNWVVELTYRRRILEVLLDFFLIAFAYYLAHVVYFRLPLESQFASHYIDTVALTIAATFGSFVVIGIYRGVWQHLSFADAVGYIKASLGGAVLAAITVKFIFNSSIHSWGLFAIFGIIQLFLLLASRFSFRWLDQVIRSPQTQPESTILIYGAGGAGELALKECLQNSALGYNPVGFVDDDEFKQGRRIHGLTVFGGFSELDRLLAEQNINGVIIASSHIESSGFAHKAIETCQKQGVWVKRMRLEFEEWD